LLVVPGPAVLYIVAQSAEHGRLAAGTLGRWLRARRQMLRYASGSVFVGLGVSAALAKRT
jgi:threonine/homoserine/homoserine lactone efflux protein